MYMTDVITSHCWWSGNESEKITDQILRGKK